MSSKGSFDAATGLFEAMVIFDPLGAQHLTATEKFAERLAKAMTLDEVTIENCRLAALLHDVGLFGMDRVILNFPGMLADTEWDIVTQHPILGERLVSRIPSIAHLAPIVRAHHERVDGSGYPDGLLDSEIPIEARVIAVTDAFHTMTMPQRYRAQFDAQRAMVELLGNKGSQFDRTVVDEFAALMGHRQRHLVALSLPEVV